MQYAVNRISSPILIIPHQERWRDEFRHAGAKLRRVLGDLAVRIDHIGSTSVPGLAAKDIIDIQITVENLDDLDAFRAAMTDGGQYRERGGIHEDHIPLGVAQTPDEWRKRYFREPEGTRGTHIHVRQQGRMNQVYALVFKDYLREHAVSARLYEQVKLRLSELFPDRIDAYLYIKDPMCDIIMQAAWRWRVETDWSPGATDA